MMGARITPCSRVFLTPRGAEMAKALNDSPQGRHRIKLMAEGKSFAEAFKIAFESEDIEVLED